MTALDAPRIQISRPDELIETVPYLLGFHPSESLVLIGFSMSGPVLSAGHRVEVALRVDRPDPLLSELPPEYRTLPAALTRSQASAAVVLIYSDTDLTDPAHRQLADQVGVELERAGLTVLDAMIVSAERWRSLRCSDPSCCPPEGVLREPDSSPAAARATVAGLVARADRDAVAALLDGRSEAERNRLVDPLDRAESRMTQAVLDHRLTRLRRADAAAIRRAYGADPATLTDRQVARFGVALTDLIVRDEIWVELDDDPLPAEPLLRELLTRLPPPYDAAPLFLFGWGQWRQGNGALAGMAAERALRSDPDYSAAIMLLTGLQGGLNPHTTPRLRDGA